MRRLGLQGGRWPSPGGTLRSFSRLLVIIHRVPRVSVQSGLDTVIGLRTPRRRTLCVMNYRGEKLRSAPPGPRHRPPRRPRRRTLCFMIYRHEKLWCAPPGIRRRTNEFAYEPTILPFLRIVFVQNRKSIKLILMFCSWTLARLKNISPVQNRAFIFWTNFQLERSILPFLRIVHVQNRTVDKININVLLLNTFSFKKPLPIHWPVASSNFICWFL